MNALVRILGRAFDIRTGEWNRLVLLYFFAFMLNVSVVWGKASSEALFLTQVGVDILPYMFIADAILSILALIVYTAFADRISNLRMMVLILLAGAAVTGGIRIIFTFGIQPDFMTFDPSFLALYLVARVGQVIISIHAWTYIADFYDTRTAKRHFPLIASGSRTSGMAAGLLILPIVTVFSAEDLVIAWALSLVGAAFIAWYAPRRSPIMVEETDKTQETRSFIENIQDGFGYVNSSNFLRLMGLAAFLSTVLIYLLDFQSQAYFVERFDTTEDLAAFFGVLGAVADFITLPIQMFILSRIVTKLGVGNANLIFPSISALSYTLLLNPTLASASLARVNHTAFRSAFRTPLDSLLYNAVPVNVKARARAFNGLLFPIGSLVAGLILIGLPIDDRLKAIGLAVAIGYMLVAYRLRREYARSLTQLLTEDEMNIFRLADATEDQPREITIRLLQQRINQTEDEALTVFLAEMLFDLQGRPAIGYLLELGEERGGGVKAGIIDLVGEFWQENEQVRQLCFDSLASDIPAVQRAALHTLVGEAETEGEHDAVLLDKFLALLEEDDEAIQSMVIPPLIASGDFYYLAPGVERLSRWLSKESNNRERTLGLRVLARTGSERMVRTMVRYLQDPEPMVRRQAADLIDNLSANTFNEEIRDLGLRTLAGLLDDDDETVRLAAVNGLGNFETAEAGQALMKALGDKNFTVRQRATELMTKRVGEELETFLDDDNQYMAESTAFILSRSNNARARRRALELMGQLVGDTYALVAQRLPLTFMEQPGVDLLRDTLAEQENLLMDRFFWLLGALSTPEEANTIRVALQDESDIKQANAVEALESLSSPGIARQVAPLYASKQEDLSTQVQEWKTTLNLAVITKWQAFFQFWPRLRVASKTDAPSRKLYLPDDDGWLRATAIFALTEMDLADLGNGKLDSPITEEAVRLALEASTHDDAVLVRETAQIGLQRLRAAELGKLEEKKMLSTIEKVIFLKEVPFFKEMTIAQLRVLASISEEVEYKEGETIFEEGEFGDALYVVIEGEVGLQKKQQRGMTTSIRRLTVTGKREYFAEMSIFDDKPHQYDAVAIKNSLLLLVRRETLVALLNHQPDLALTLLRALSERLRDFTDVIAEKSEAKPQQLVDLFDRLG